MDAPKGRYRVEEKDGRLVVIDTATGSPASSPGPPPPRLGAGPVAQEPGLAERLGRAMLRLAVRRWDEQGRAVVAWQWKEGDQLRRWNATLDSGQQRRFGRALLAFAAFPIVLLLSILFGALQAWPLVAAAFAASAWGVRSIQRLMAETGR
jgi:hypothetical protein